jgi:hypothetical protein
MGALGEATVSVLPPPPAGSKIQAELSGDTLSVMIPGRWTLAFWASLLVSVLFTAVAFGMIVGSRSSSSGLPAFLEWLFLGWGPLMFAWFFFVFKARTERLSLDRALLETRGAFLPLAPRKLNTLRIREFALKQVGPQHLVQGPLAFYGFNRRKLLFAVGDRDVAIAIQAEDAELAWLRGLLESHRQKFPAS